MGDLTKKSQKNQSFFTKKLKISIDRIKIVCYHNHGKGGEGSFGRVVKGQKTLSEKERVRDVRPSAERSLRFVFLKNEIALAEFFWGEKNG